MDVSRNITLDTIRENTFAPILSKQFDADTRSFVCSFTADLEPLNLEGFTAATFNIRRYDGSANSFYAVINENTVVATIPEWAMEVPGMANCSVSLYRNGNAVLTTASFGLFIQQAEREGQILVFTASSILAPGTYYFTIDGNNYQFTTTRNVPAGGSISITNDGAEINTYNKNGISIETGLAVEDDDSGEQLPYGQYVDLFNELILAGGRAEEYSDLAAQYANAAAASASEAEGYKESAELSAQAAIGSANDAFSYASGANISAEAAAEAAVGASISEDNALDYAERAETAQTAAETAQTAADASKTEAGEYAVAAASSAAGAASSASAAAGSAANAGTAATSAAAAAQSANDAKSAAQESMTAAEGHAEAAEGSASLAAGKAAAAAQSADDALGSARSAMSSASAASASADEIKNLTVSAHELPAGSTPTVEKTGGSGTPYNLDFGIPAGGGGGADLPETTALLKGDGAGGAAAATPGTDYATPEQVSAKYTKPGTGIPASDLAPGVIPETSEADGMDIVESIGTESTDEEIPTAKAVYDYIQSLNGNGVSY